MHKEGALLINGHIKTNGFISQTPSATCIVTTMLKIINSQYCNMNIVDNKKANQLFEEGSVINRHLLKNWTSYKNIANKVHVGKINAARVKRNNRAIQFHKQIDESRKEKWHDSRKEKMHDSRKEKMHDDVGRLMSDIHDDAGRLMSDMHILQYESW